MGRLHLGARHFKSFLVGTLRVVHYAFEGWIFGDADITEGKGNRQIMMGSEGKDTEDRQHNRKMAGKNKKIN